MNTKSKVVCLILWFYSIEPPFYAVLNDACSQMDTKFIKTLGPFAQALLCILASAEKYKDNKMLSGE